MAIFDLTGHPQLGEAVTEQGADYLDWQTRQAEAVLGATAPPPPEPYLQAFLDALVIQVNWQEETGVDARMLESSARAGVKFRSEKESGLLPLADPQAVAMWAHAQSVYAASLAPVVVEDGRWKTVRRLR